MPLSEKARRYAFAELGRRKKGLASRGFKSMSKDELEEYAHAPLEKKKKKRGLAERK